MHAAPSTQTVAVHIGPIRMLDLSSRQEVKTLQLLVINSYYLLQGINFSLTKIELQNTVDPRLSGHNGTRSWPDM